MRCAPCRPSLGTWAHGGRTRWGRQRPRSRCLTACALHVVLTTHAPRPAQAEFKELVAWWKDVLGPAVTAVKISGRLATSPAIVVTSQYGWSANMERIMKAQARRHRRRTDMLWALAWQLPRPLLRRAVLAHTDANTILVVYCSRVSVGIFLQQHLMCASGAAAGPGRRGQGLHEGAEDAGNQPAAPDRPGAQAPGGSCKRTGQASEGIQRSSQILAV